MTFRLKEIPAGAIVILQFACAFLMVWGWDHQRSVPITTLQVVIASFVGAGLAGTLLSRYEIWRITKILTVAQAEAEASMKRLEELKTTLEGRE